VQAGTSAHTRRCQLLAVHLLLSKLRQSFQYQIGGAASAPKAGRCVLVPSG
jgi:hypothetical protein